VRRQAHKGEQLELLRFQRDEIVTADVTEGEDRSLEKERLRLKNGQFLFETAQLAIDRLYGGEGAVVEQIGELGRQLARAAEIDDRLRERAGEMDGLLFGVEESVTALRTYLGQLEMDPGRLESVEERLDVLNRLKRKYGGSLDAVIEFVRDADRRLDAVESIDATIEALRREIGARHAELCGMARELSRQRREAARKLARRVETELTVLRMANTRFEVQMSRVDAGPEADAFLVDDGRLLGESGVDRATFMMAPNVGEPLKPLASIASGGELSRVVLALKAILARSDSLETVVFDEVDAGIGGGVAEVVGKKLAVLADRHQILCITHLPQIAKFGTHHFRIVKNVSRGRTRTSIMPLNDDERVTEIARMLGGEDITPITLDHARELLNQP
jgi:DNA repair protein RecN (Recombination protein N)